MYGTTDTAEPARQVQTSPTKKKQLANCECYHDSQTGPLVGKTPSHLRAPKVIWGKPSLHSCQLSLNKAAVNSFTLFSPLSSLPPDIR